MHCTPQCKFTHITSDVLQWGKWKVSSWEEKDHQWWEKSYLVQIWSHTGFSGEDILFAMSTLGFDNYVEPLKLYLQKYREAMKVCLKKEPITTWVLHSLVFRVRGKWRRSFPTLEEKLWLDSSFRFGIPPPTNSLLPIIDHLCWQPSWFDTKPVWSDLVIYFVNFRPWLPARVMSCSPIAMASSSNFRIVISSSIERREEQHWWQQLYTKNIWFTAEKRAPDLNSCALKWTNQKTGGASTKKLAFLLFSFQHHVSPGHSTNHVLYPHVLEVMLYSCIVCHWNCYFPKVFSSV